ncbi:Planctomycete cytochrome C [Stieleria neptunia]|uniref:Planctomycete cytochrome C n=1 Tax=Stieleria neptunia TaxID=2527979 RepID=A0A518HHS3_9BACT|nr:DUF1553 domain-containing protein [Stieleria neptunia]QDV40396.1 Planctomycete cytochrome C [Stieleria neptunia]
MGNESKWRKLPACDPRRLARRTCSLAALLLLSLLPTASLAAAESVPPGRDLFEIHVRPMLMQHCIKCHGESKQEGGLRLDTFESLLQGGDSGPVIVAGKPEESLLLEALRYESFEMPPSGQLDDSVSVGIEQWIQADSPWPQGLVLKPTPKITDTDRDWWCYQPIGNPDVPQVDDNGWCRNEIDHFVFQRLDQEGIEPASQSESGKLVRRAHFAVTGLPPSGPSSASLATGEGWYEALVDQLLDEPAYGENQARYWLDLVRYADSDGYNADHGRPEAYHYRDYVIRSFNEDKSYDRFIMEQLAGDEVDPGNRDALIGTMYLRHWIYEWNQRDVEGQWQQILSDVTETTADVFLAQGLKCARCHDHKFDPLLQKDYFAMKAFFAPLQPREDQPIADVETRTRYLQQQQAWEAATEDIRERLHEIETPVLLEHATREGFDKFTKEIRAMISSRRCDRSPYEHQIASLASNQFDVHPEKLAEWLDEETEAERQRLRKQLAEFDDLKPEPLPTLKFVASDVGPVAPPTTIPDSADSSPIPPGYPVILDDKPAEIQPPPAALRSTGRRTALARWITDPDNPLTARVIVNRVWQQHFGRGLVETTSDFGRLGTPPSHPELLDWLARRFMQDGWSLKKLHRLILTSATYRQSSERPMDEQLAKLDPQNVFLWRMNPRRLSGEEIHDAVLVASGKLAKEKRAIYKTVKRNKLDPLLAVFDFPDRVESQCKRHRTTTSPQALLMMNDPWLHDRATDLSREMDSASLETLVRSVYQNIYFREPSDVELQQAAQFVGSYESISPMPAVPKQLTSFPDGRSAISLKAERPTEIQIPAVKTLQTASDTTASDSGDFTIEATVMLDSLYPDASVRTIVANWSGNQSQRGWSLGVTSTKSAFKPRNLILQLIGSRDDPQGKPEYEVVASDLRLELNRPYYVAVSIDLDDASKNGITFYVQDLSKPDGKPQVANVQHRARWNVQADRPIEIGGRSNRHRWDGLIQNVRLHQAALSGDEVVQQMTGDASKARLVFDVQFAKADRLGQDLSGNDLHAVIQSGDATTASPRERARVALLHALLCSNEMIYVD